MSQIKRSDSTAGLRNESDSEFQTVGPATEKAQVPKVLRRNCGIFSYMYYTHIHKLRSLNVHVPYV